MSFVGDMQFGNWGEKKVMGHLLTRFPKLQDVTKIPEYQKRDIDLVMPDGTTIEVKTDRVIRRTGNVYLEDYKKGKTERDGWWRYCQADVLAYVEAQHWYVYWIDMKKLRNYVKDKNLKSQATCPDIDKGTTTYAFLIPIKELIDNNVCFKHFSLESY